ncbi:MAG: hypothetical protein JXQ67_07670 [Campylobacterales bacterium]|nr:hypothetical protein [Campylobacterales bacterium]
MKVAVPVSEILTLYKYNPHTAPKFAIYDLTKVDHEVEFSLHSIVENKICEHKNNLFSSHELMCTCDSQKKNSFPHRCEHFALLEFIGECSYLLAYTCCENTKKSLKLGGIATYKIPPIISQIEIAMKNFIIGGYLEYKIERTCNAS